jgi:hypothetical protein
VIAGLLDVESPQASTDSLPHRLIRLLKILDVIILIHGLIVNSSPEVKKPYHANTIAVLSWAKSIYLRAKLDYTNVYPPHLLTTMKFSAPTASTSAA